jgi:hypothetical protein
MSAGLAGIGLIVTIGCGRVPAGHGERRHDLPDISIARSTLPALIDSLSRVQGTVVESSSGAWHIAGIDGLLRSFPQFGDSAVRPLAQCIADTSFARVTLRGTPVRVGLVCFAALQMVAYSEIDMSGNWPGAVLPSATAEDLIKASKAWQDAAEHRDYKLN